ncbi:hypothetical protein H4S06_001574 [Coemansia sp. BCRC 34490]|nr:hypothetical protein H4S06_001574 [Coemansia sp. BCRC 34490]
MTLPYILARRKLNFGRQLTLPLFALNAGAGILLFAQGCLSCMEGDVRHVMLGLGFVFLGTLTFASELIHIAVIRMYASFLYSFCGRGVFYVALGCVSVDTDSAALGIGITLVVIGVGFLATALVPRIHFDDPDDHYAAAIYNIQHGIYATQQRPPLMAETARGPISAPISNPSIGAYPPSQGIGSANAGPNANTSSSLGQSTTSFIPHKKSSRYSASLASSQQPYPGVSEKPPRV